MKRRHLPLLFAFASMPAIAQTLAPVGVDLFGDEIVKPIPLQDGQRIIAAPKTTEKRPAVEGFGHILLFHDGRQLRGTLVELTADEIIWMRPDADAALRLPRKSVRRIELTEPVKRDTMIVVRAREKDAAEDDLLVPATIKLPGSDWLFGDLRSENGQDFSLKLANGSTVQFSKSHVEWIYFGQKPVPAVGFQGGALDLEGWILGNSPESPEVKGDSFLLSGNSYLGRNIHSPPRFRVDFVLPDAGKADTMKLWLQPFSPSPNSYSTGTVELAFGPKQLGYLIYSNVFERKTVNYPAESMKSDGPLRFTVFYDAPKDRLIVQRNGTTIGEWKLQQDPDQPAQPAMGPQRPRGICFNRDYGSQKLTLGHMSVRPWNGENVTGSEERPVVEQVTVGEEAPKPGTLESVAEKELTVGGRKIPRKSDTFLEFSKPVKGMASGDALLMFGDNGEVATAELRVREGRAICRTSIIPKFDVSTDSLETIVFPTVKLEPAKPSDVLVFRNGDSLPGSLLGTSNGSAVRWKTSDGQELAFQPAHVAGIRLQQAQPPKLGGGSVAELTNGDRLAGEILALDSETMRFRNEFIGERSIARGRLQTLHADLKSVLLDSGADPELWMGLRPPKAPVGVVVQKPPTDYQGRIYLDGYFLGSANRSGNYRYQGISHLMDKPPERYELRCVMTDSNGGDPSLSASLAGKEGSSLQVNLGYGRLRVYGYNLGNRRGGGLADNRQVALSSKLSSLTSRREMRMFVDTVEGSVDVLVDGVHFYKLGKKTSEKALGLGARISLSLSSSGGVGILSNVSIRPWNGEVPVPGEFKGSVQLKNGDSASGEIGDVKDGKLSVKIGPEPIDVPLERITSVEFAQEPAAGKAAGRIRLTDGAIVNLDEFTWRDGMLTAKSPALGELKLDQKAVAQLILSPPAAYVPMRPEAKKLVSKEPGKEGKQAE